ncbi:hypothetical protein FW778_16850 [Ginsengibacter hankyongi]|uniref:NADP-dependent oxidoreductase domain-containing protein n=1 Tax=Ginsengibacter hankyongi TaxID=2607284 RepID=A0A5J5IDC0_9BACT|nr:aldo/keto reductase [Ginsengibacter hankyongi]KAA9037757.1 hypothetical protein FW778_16850 [Ginsengibacter hankyongi]
MLLYFTTGLGGGRGEIDRKESIKSILMALENGITCIDTALAYRDAESFVGIALNQREGQKPSVNNVGGNSNIYNPATDKWGIEGKDVRHTSFSNYLPCTFGIQNFQSDHNVFSNKIKNELTDSSKYFQLE